MNDENIALAVKEAIGKRGTLLQNKVFFMAPTYENEVGRRLATVIYGELAEGKFKHIEFTVNDTKAEVTEKVKKALKDIK